MAKKVKGGLTTPKGFYANSLNCGIKKNKNDLALLFSKAPAKAFAVFTKNKVKATPVIVSQRHVKNSLCRAIIVNSGNANCCNGKNGMRDAVAMVKATANGLDIQRKEVLVASTGIIGKAFPIKLVKRAIPSLIKGFSEKKGPSFAKAIMKTDRFSKEIAVKIKLGACVVTIGGAAKGAGMINPNMATMLSFITTDAKIDKSALKDAFNKAVDKSFNAISVDGTMSTNDSVFILANGQAENKTISKGTAAYNKFYKALEYVMVELAKMVVLNGEGVTKFVHVIVKNAKIDKDAKKIASSVANDLLFKTSLYGEDPNWGRIAAAVGYSGAELMLDKLDIYLGDKKVLSNGVRVNTDRKSLRNIYKKKNIEITVDVKLGKRRADFFTSDISKKYIDINASYSS